MATDKTRKSALPRGSTTSLPLALIGAAVVIGLAALLPLIQSSGATTTSARLQNMEQSRADWEARLQELQVEVATLGGLERIEQEAVTRLKMAPAQETIYLKVDTPGPESRKLPSRFLPTSTTTEESEDKSLWGKLFGWLPLP